MSASLTTTSMVFSEDVGRESTEGMLRVMGVGSGAMRRYWSEEVTQE